MDITFKNVPGKIAEKVKRAVATVVEKYYSNLELTPTSEAKQRYRTSVDSFREDNDMEKKFDVQKDDPEKGVET